MRTVKLVVGAGIGIAEAWTCRYEVPPSRAVYVGTQLIDEEVLVPSVNAAVENAHVDRSRARLDRVCLGCANLPHAPLQRLQRVRRLLWPTAGHALWIQHGQSAALQRLLHAGKLLPAEILVNRFDKRRGTQRLRKEVVGRRHDHHADLLGKIGRNRAARSLHERQRRGVVERVAAAKLEAAIQRVLAGKDDEIVLDIAGGSAGCRSRHRAQRQQNHESNRKQALAHRHAPAAASETTPRSIPIGVHPVHLEPPDT